MNYKKRQTTKQYFKRRFLRTAVPFAIWSSIYFIWGFITGWVKFTGVRSFLNYFLDNRIVTMFWFFYAIIAIYLFIPILSVLVENSSRKMLWYLCALCFTGTTIIRAINIYTGLSISSYFNIPMGSGYIGFVLLGYLLNTADIKRPYRFSIYLSGILGVFIMTIGTYFLSKKQGSLNGSFMNYQSVCCVMIAIAAFILIKEIPFDKLVNSKFKQIISMLSGASLGVYLSQMIVLTIVDANFRQLSNTWHYMLWAPLVIYLVLVSFTLLIKKIPVLKNIMP